MYALIIALLLGGGLLLIRDGIVQSRHSRVIAGVGVMLLTAASFGLMSLWGEMLWFEALGFGRRYWLFLGAETTTMLLGAFVAMALTAAITWPLENRLIRNLAILITSVIGIAWGTQSWSELLMFLNRVDSGIHDPLFGYDTGFYLFALPFYKLLYGLLVFCVLVGIGASLLALGVRDEQADLRSSIDNQSDGAYRPLLVGSLVLSGVLAAGYIIDSWQLLFSDMGVVKGAGWTDIHVRLPAYLGLAVALPVLGVLPFFPRIRQRISVPLHRLTTLQASSPNALIAIWVTIGMLWMIGLGILPQLVQWVVVEPNEITFEKPYLERNIHFTLQGFHLDKVEERQFPASERLTPAMVEHNAPLLSEVRLWDWRALKAVYKQFQEIRLYYEFVDVDVDRYTFGDRYGPVMVSARELSQQNLVPQSQTFVNRRFKYTHGYGLTLATVNDFTEEGLPNLLLKDIPPHSNYPKLKVSQPQIYYGELTQDPVVVNTDELEFDYPSGEQNQYIHYSGKGGVAMGNLWRKFLFGWKFDGTPLLFSTYPNAASRIMFYRQVRKRVKQIAPFLEFDEDPYIVLVNGRLYWIIDAYTTSKFFPYSEPFSSREFVEYRNHDRTGGFTRRTVEDLQGINYVRNSVKAVVDAFDGHVDFYVFEPRDPIIQVWQRILPGVFKPEQEMPKELRRHVRYPRDFLLTQGLVYAKYHMRDPEVFYNQEDLWVRATEKHYDRVEPVEPYYIMWELPRSDRAEFVLIQPFTPKNRQVLNGWIAGLSDGKNYGRFLAYKFPKEKRVLGPQQVETKIDQDSFLSGQLTLWDQRGSNVIRGNVLAIPIDDTIIYVEPIYLQAETAAYPELRLVVAMHGDTMSYAENFDAALAGLFKAPSRGVSEIAPQNLSIKALGQQLNQTFNAYLQALGNKQFDAAAVQLKKLSDLISSAAGGTDTRLQSNEL